VSCLKLPSKVNSETAAAVSRSLATKVLVLRCYINNNYVLDAVCAQYIHAYAIEREREEEREAREEEDERRVRQTDMREHATGKDYRLQVPKLSEEILPDQVSPFSLILYRLLNPKP
jgi:hypothetical protein